MTGGGPSPAGRPWRGGTLPLIASLLVANLAGLACVVVIGVEGLARLGREEERELRVAIALIVDAYRLKVALEKELIGQRTYLLSGDPALLKPWREGSREFAGRVAALRELQRGPEDERVLELVRREERQYQALAARTGALMAAGRLDAARALYKVEGYPAKARLIGAVDALIADKHADVGRLHEEVGRAEADARTRLALAALVSIPLGLLLAAFVWLRIGRPLMVLERAAVALEAGDFTVRAPVARSDEFGHVATAFNRMAASVEVAVRDLRAANEELRRVDRYRDDFLSTVTHELRTPLTAINGFAEALLRRDTGELGEQPRAAIQRIARQAARMQRLVGDLLDSTAIRLGKLEVAPIACEPSQPLADALAALAPLAAERGSRLEAALAPAAPVALDPDRVAQVMTNLVSNALKFSPPGATVRVTGAAGPDGYRVRVADEGPGIPAEDEARLFRSFSRLTPKGPDRPGGTGLGLWIAKALVEAHGGQIGLEREGPGAVFWFELPWA